MIPSLPEAISATHVEYLPLPPACLRPIIDASRSRNPLEPNNARPIPAEHFGQRVVTKEELAKIRALRAMQQFIPINISAVPRSVSLSYFRGNDLRYAPHVRVPAAESVQNS
ncbi:uncharacterized protein LOC135844009 [Planococcus citri]|uniref:uncharacterized protein LOC135844009 n=1 Tax=Planococcus citri TaxID=170843 RepID=UPI0031FA03CB